MERWPLVPLAAALALGPACRGTPTDAISITVPYEVSTLDPHAQDTISNFATLSNIYEAVVATDAEMRVTPGLASSWENPDPLTWIFHLRTGVRFHRGRSLSARDVVYSLDRVQRSTRLEMRGYVREVSAVEALDDRTVRLRTQRPTRILLNKLSFILVVPEGATDESLDRMADGTGPYALAGWVRARDLHLRRNAAYWGRRPAVQEVHLVLGQAPEAAAAALATGRHQLIQCNSKSIEAPASASGRFEVLKQANIYVKYLGYDLSRDKTPFCRVMPNPFRDPRVRRAVSAALDREQLVSRLSARAVPATQPVPRFIFGFDPQMPAPVPDRDAARALLRQAGLGGGFEVVLHARRILSEAAFLVRDQLAAVGIRVEVRLVGDDDFFRMAERNEVSFWLSRYGCPTGDASHILESVIHSRDVERQLGLYNWGRYSDPDLDRGIEASAQIEKDGERRAALQGLLGRVMDQLVVIPLYNDQDVYALDRRYAWRPRADSYIRAAEIALR